MVHVNGRSGHISGERAEAIVLEEATIDRSAIRYMEAGRADLERSAVMRLQAKEASFTGSSVAFAKFEHGTIRQGVAGVVIGKSVACDEVRTFVLASPVVRGEVHTWLDLRTAVAIGFGMALGRLAIAAIRAAARRAAG